MGLVGLVGVALLIVFLLHYLGFCMNIEIQKHTGHFSNSNLGMTLFSDGISLCGNIYLIPRPYNPINEYINGSLLPKYGDPRQYITSSLPKIKERMSWRNLPPAPRFELKSRNKELRVPNLTHRS